MKRNPLSDGVIKLLSVLSNIARVVDFLVKYGKPIKDYFESLL
jgi:hypothetical protein